MFMGAMKMFFMKRTSYSFNIISENTTFIPSSEHFWQVWLISVQRFQRRRFKCEKLTDGQTDGRTDDGRLSMTKAHMAYGVYPPDIFGTPNNHVKVKTVQACSWGQ
jgi:hypothetical protein